MMLSRVAENLYWMGRYLERAENMARLINATTLVLLDLPKEASFGWDVLLKAVGLEDMLSLQTSLNDEDSIVRFLMEAQENPSSILASLNNARENARTVREVLPSELWERINSLYLYSQEHISRARQGRGPRNEVLQQLISQREGISGLIADSMSRDVAFAFMRMGRSLERADMCTRIIDIHRAVKLPESPAMAALATERMWMSTLRALSAYQMYRRHVGVHVRADAVVGFLLKDSHFPRSVIYCLSELEELLSSLPGHEVGLKALRQLWRWVESLPLADGAQTALDSALDRLQTELGAVHNAISAQYFGRA